MTKKKPLPKDESLKDFLRSGGRIGAESDFNNILKKAIKPNKDKSPKNSKNK